METYICSGDGPGTHESCDFRTNSLREATAHFETTGGHNVDEVPDATAGMRNIPNPSMAARRDILAWAQTAGLEALRTWLKWNDPNGEYDDTPESLEVYGPFTRDDALRNITEQVESI